MLHNQKSNEVPYKQVDDEDAEIDLLGIVKTLWKGRLTIFIAVGICAVFGILAAISSPTEYTVSTVMVPQMASGSKSQLSGLASLAGIDIGMSQNSEMSPVIYPKIVNSVPFKLIMMNTLIHTSKSDKPITVLDYYTNPIYNKPSVMAMIKKYTLGLPGVILGSLKKKQESAPLPEGVSVSKIISLTKDQKQMMKLLNRNMTLAVEKKEGYITLTVSMPEALAAAEMAQAAQELLQREIIKFKVEKSQADLDFIQGRYDIAKAEAEGYQVKVAVNTDRFKNLTSSLPQVKTNQIQTKYGVANNVFLELAKQLEQAKLQVKKDTPVFMVVEPVTIPTTKSKPNKPMILLMWLVFGGIIGMGIVYGKQFFSNEKLKLNE